MTNSVRLRTKSIQYGLKDYVVDARKESGLQILVCRCEGQRFRISLVQSDSECLRCLTMIPLSS